MMTYRKAATVMLAGTAVLACLALMMTPETKMRRAKPVSHASKRSASPPELLAPEAATEDRLAGLRTRLSDATRSVRDLRAKATATTSRLRACEARLAETTQTIRSMERETAALQTEQSRLQAARSRSGSELDSLQFRGPPPDQLAWVLRNPRRAPPTRQEHAEWSRTPGLQQRMLAERQASRRYVDETARLGAEIQSVNRRLEDVTSRLTALADASEEAELRAEELHREQAALLAEAERYPSLLAAAEQELGRLQNQHDRLAKRLLPRPPVVQQASHEALKAAAANSTRSDAAQQHYFGPGFAPRYAGTRRRAFDHLPPGLRVVLLAELSGIDCGVRLADFGLDLEDDFGLQPIFEPYDDCRLPNGTLDFRLPGLD